MLKIFKRQIVNTSFVNILKEINQSRHLFRVVGPLHFVKSDVILTAMTKAHSSFAFLQSCLL